MYPLCNLELDDVLMTTNDEDVTCEQCCEIINQMNKDLNGDQEVGLAFNQRIMVCRNKECEYFNKERKVSLPLIGTEVYVGDRVFCKCSYAMYWVGNKIETSSQQPDQPRIQIINHPEPGGQGSRVGDTDYG
jgi:hypothetical protein